MSKKSLNLADPEASAVPGAFAKWKESRHWLEVRPTPDGMRMFCSLCVEQRPKSTGGQGGDVWWTSGCKRMKLHSVTDHENSTAHRRSLEGIRERAKMEDAGGLDGLVLKKNSSQNQKFDDAMIRSMKALYWIAKEDLPLQKWNSLKDLLVQVGVDLSPLNVARNANYTSERILGELLEALAETVRDDTRRLIKESSFIGLSADETTDVSNLTQLDIHLRLVCQGEIRSRFGLFKSLSDTTARTISDVITSWCEEQKMDMRRMHFSSDGAATFTGRHAGVAARMKAANPHMVSVHCVAHREALAAADACHKVDFLRDTFQPVLGGVFRFFDNSPKREAAFHAVQELLDLSQVKLKEPKFVRWLSHDAAVQAFVKSLPAILMALEREVEENRDLAAKAYAKKIKCQKFVASLLLFADVLPHLSRLSKQFQKTDLDFSQLKPALETAMTSIRQLLGKEGAFESKLQDHLSSIEIEFSDSVHDIFKTTIRKRYLEALLDRLNDRFPAMPILDALGIFSPANIRACPENTLCDLGNERLDVLTEFLGEKEAEGGTVPALVDAVKVREEWIHLKSLVRNVPSLQACDTTKTLASELHANAAVYQVRSLTAVLDWGLAITLSTAESERDFSRLGLIKTARRNRLLNTTVNNLMVIALDGPPAKDFKFEEALRKFHRMPQTARRLPTAQKAASTLSTNKVDNPVPLPRKRSADQKPKPKEPVKKEVVPSPAKRPPSSNNSAPPAKRSIASFFQAASTKPRSQKESPSGSRQDADFDKWEVLLPKELSQSTIDGRNGSNACTVICAMFCASFLKSEAQFCTSVHGRENYEAAMCQAMRDGNRKYDEHGWTACLSCEEVCDLQPPIGVSVAEDVFVRHGQIGEVFTKLQAAAGSHPHGLAAALFIVHPYSFCVLRSPEAVLLFDSHRHGPNGALLAALPIHLGEQYLAHFFQKYYDHLGFGSSAKYGQLSILQ